MEFINSCKDSSKIWILPYAYPETLVTLQTICL